MQIKLRWLRFFDTYLLCEWEQSVGDALWPVPLIVLDIPANVLAAGHETSGSFYIDHVVNTTCPSTGEATSKHPRPLTEEEA